MKITLRQLEIFSAIAAHGKVTQAAETVAITQSAASTALAELEGQLGVSLFERTGRTLRLNEAGRQVLARSVDILDRVREIEGMSSDMALAFDLRLGASLTIGKHLMPTLLAELMHSYPESKIHLTLQNTERVVDDLLNHRIDIGFVEGPVQDERIQRFFWRADILAVFVAPEHPLAHQTVSFEDIKYLSWILREKGSGTREVFDRAIASLSDAAQPLRILFELAQPEAIRQCVRVGLGAGCLPLLELYDAFAAGWLAPVNTPFLNLSRQFQVILYREKHVSRGIQTVLSACGIAHLL